MVVYSVFAVKRRCTLYKCKAYHNTENTLIKFTVGSGLSLPPSTRTLVTSYPWRLPGFADSLESNSPVIINPYQEDGQNIKNISVLMS
jgi:hypothetical protein